MIVLTGQSLTGYFFGENERGASEDANATGDPNMKQSYRTVGKALPRVEGYGKVTGQTQFAADLPFEGLLWAKVLRSPIPHGRIKGIDVSKAKALAGVRAVLTGADVRDIYVGSRVKDQPVLAYDKVRMAGDAVAAVAA